MSIHRRPFTDEERAARLARWDTPERRENVRQYCEMVDAMTYDEKVDHRLDARNDAIRRGDLDGAWTAEFLLGCEVMRRRFPDRHGDVISYTVMTEMEKRGQP